MSSLVVPEFAETIGENAPVERFEPFSDFILIEPLKRGQTAAGIAIPDGADPEPRKGRVVKCGPGRITEEGKLIEMVVKPGDLIYLHFAYAPPVELTLGNKQYIVSRARDLLAKVVA